MGVSFEPVSGYLVRAGDLHSQVGDQYRVSAVANIKDSQAEIMGVDRMISKEEYRATIRGLKKLGVTKIMRARRNGTNVRKKEIGMQEPVSVEMSIKDASGKVIFECAWREMEKQNLLHLEEAIMKGVLGLNAAQQQG